MKNSKFTKNGILSLLLVLLAVLTGCVTTAIPADTDTVSETSVPETEDRSGMDDLPADLTLNGRTVVIASRNQDKMMNELTVEGLKGEIVNDAIYRRELSVEERLNCEIENERPGIDLELNDMVNKSVLSGDQTYDVVANSNFYISSSGPNGMYLNLFDVDNLNLEKAYWFQGLIESSAVMDSLYAVTGALSLFTYQELYVVFFNRNLCESYGILPESVYATVFNGEWTLDNMITLTKDVYTDVNGNKTQDVNDVYGFGLQVTSSTDAYFSSCDIRISEIGKDGGISLNTDMDKLFDVTDKLCDFAHNQNGVLRLIEQQRSDLNSFGSYLPNGFSEEHFLFTNDWLYATETPAFRNMTSDYGILPYPKYDEMQENYITYLHDQFTNFALPLTTEKPEEVGAVLEALASYSYQYVLPVYYDVTLTTKYARDESSVKCLDTIFSHIYLDPAFVYIRYLDKYPCKLLRERIQKNDTNVASIAAQYSDAAQAALDKLNDSFAKVEG